MPGPERQDSGFRILEHPADIGIEAWGRGPADAFASAARALISIIVDPATVATTTRLTVTLVGTDPDHLLVKWLEEILYLYDGEGFVAVGCEVTSFSPTSLTATLNGEAIDPGRHETRLDVKAVTYHQLSIDQRPDRTTVRVFLDI